MQPQPPVRRFTAVLLLALGLGGATVAALALSSASNSPHSRVYFSAQGAPARARRRGQPIAVQTAEVTRASVTTVVAAPGEAVPLKEIQIRPLVVGPVDRVFVREGQRVRKGQPLLEVQKGPYQDAVAAARNNLGLARAKLANLQRTVPERLQKLRFAVANTKETYEIVETQFQQMKTLAEAGATSRLLLLDFQAALAENRNSYLAAEQNLRVEESELARQLDSAALELRNREVALQVAERELSRTTLYAPQDSLVSKLNVFAGNAIDLRFASPLMTLVEDVVFKAYADQTLINAIRPGDRAVVRLSAYPGSTFSGRVTAINPTVVTTATPTGSGPSRQFTFPVWISVEGVRLAPGLQGFAEFRKVVSSVFVPETAVAHLSGGEGMAMVVRSGRAEPVRVQVGRPQDNRREVLTGLRPGERVILTPDALTPGDAVVSANPR